MYKSSLARWDEILGSNANFVASSPLLSKSSRLLLPRSPYNSSMIAAKVFSCPLRSLPRLYKTASGSLPERCRIPQLPLSRGEADMRLA